MSHDSDGAVTLPLGAVSGNGGGKELRGRPCLVGLGRAGARQVSGRRLCWGRSAVGTLAVAQVEDDRVVVGQPCITFSSLKLEAER
jgi:hypothetical protein